MPRHSGARQKARRCSESHLSSFRRKPEPSDFNRRVRRHPVNKAALLAIELSSLLVTNGLAAADVGVRLTPEEIHWSTTDAANRQPGSSMQGGVETLVIHGDSSANGLFSIMFRVAPNAAIQAHSHPDARSCFVLTGVWRFGYGDRYDAAQLKSLPVGSHYTEPAGIDHFAATGPEGATVVCTANGPTGTTFAKPR
jgi:hypothetical protein